MQPIKLELRFPKIPNKLPDEKFKVTLLNFDTQVIEFEVQVEEAAIYRKNLHIDSSSHALIQTNSTTCA